MLRLLQLPSPQHRISPRRRLLLPLSLTGSRRQASQEWLLPMDDVDKTRKGGRAEEQHSAAKSSCTEPSKSDPAASSDAYKTAASVCVSLFQSTFTASHPLWPRSTLDEAPLPHGGLLISPKVVHLATPLCLSHRELVSDHPGCWPIWPGNLVGLSKPDCILPSDPPCPTYTCPDQAS